MRRDRAGEVWEDKALAGTVVWLVLRSTGVSLGGSWSYHVGLVLASEDEQTTVGSIERHLVEQVSCEWEQDRCLVRLA